MNHEERSLWSALWTREANELRTNLSAPLVVGNGPVSLLLFQPGNQGGKVIYLDRDNGKQIGDPIVLNPGPAFKKALYREGELGSWTPRTEKVSEDAARAFVLETEEKMRKRFIDGERKRYGKRLKATADHHWDIDETFRIIPCLPSPLYHTDRDWWRNLPRLGACYTVGNAFEEHLLLGAGSNSGAETIERAHKTADSLLLVCAISAGNQIVNVRLENLLCNSIYDSFDLVRKLWQEGTKQEGELQRDSQELFLVANLLLAHGFFFPSRTALKVMIHLGAVPASVYDDHSWEYPGDPEDNLGIELEKALDDLRRDLMFLIRAAIRIKNLKATADSPSQEAMEKKLRTAILRAFSLFCGTPSLLAPRDNSKTMSLVELTPKTFKDQRWKYVGIMPPEKLAALDSGVGLIAMKVDTLRKALGSKDVVNALKVVASLCPVIRTSTFPAIDRRKKAGKGSRSWYRVNCVGMGVASGKADIASDSEDLHDWFGKYIKAKCVLKLKTLRSDNTTR